MPRKKRPIRDGDGWTDQERTFVTAFLRHRRADRALVQAGYTVPMEDRIAVAAKILGKPHVKDYIRQHDKLVRERSAMDADRAISELSRIATANLSAFLTIDPKTGECVGVDFANASDEDLAAVAEFRIETYMDGRGDDAREVKRITFKTHSKLQAIELIGKNLKMWTDKIEHSGKIEMPILDIDKEA